MEFVFRGLRPGGYFLSAFRVFLGGGVREVVPWLGSWAGMWRPVVGFGKGGGAGIFENMRCRIGG